MSCIYKKERRNLWSEVVLSAYQLNFLACRFLNLINFYTSICLRPINYCANYILSSCCNGKKYLMLHYELYKVNNECFQANKKVEASVCTTRV